MKQLILLLLLSTTAVNAQRLTLNIGGGTSQRLSPYGTFAVGYEFKNKIAMSGEALVMIMPSKPAYFGVKFSYNKAEMVQPFVAIMYRLLTTDTRTDPPHSNYVTLGGGIKANFNEFDLTATYLNRQLFIGVGASL